MVFSNLRQFKTLETKIHKWDDEIFVKFTVLRHVQIGLRSTVIAHKSDLL